MSKITKEMLVKAELVLHRAKVISQTDITDFIFVLDQYEELVNLVDDQQIMPHVGKFDPSADQFEGLYGRHKISENATKQSLKKILTQKVVYGYDSLLNLSYYFWDALLFTNVVKIMEKLRQHKNVTTT